MLSAPPSGASNGELIRWAFDALGRQDASVLRPFWTADTVERFPDRTCRGADEIVAYFEEAFRAVADWNMQVVAIAEQGDDVFVRWQLTGRHTGPLVGIEATGKPIALDGIDHFVIRDGKVISNFVVFDQMQYARQVGMLPPDGSAADKAVKAAFNVRSKLVQRFAR